MYTKGLRVSVLCKQASNALKVLRHWVGLPIGKRALGTVAVCAVVLGWGSPLLADTTSAMTGALIGDLGISAWNGSFSNATMDSRPDILPFTGPGLGAVRYTGNSPVNVYYGTNLVAGHATRISGVGTAIATASGGTTSVFGSPLTNYSLTMDPSGSHLPTAGLVGQLAGALSLPNGFTLASGATIYADFYNFVLDYNKPSDYWFDNTTGLMHQVYEGGSIDFYYNNGGSYERFASYIGCSLNNTVNYQANTTATQFNIGTGVPVGNVIVPLSITSTNIFGAVQTTGIIPAQLAVSPYIGLFGRYTTAWNVAFNGDAATIVPEASSVLIVGTCLLGCLGSRRRVATATSPI